MDCNFQVRPPSFCEPLLPCSRTHIDTYDRHMATVYYEKLNFQVSDVDLLGLNQGLRRLASKTVTVIKR